MTNQFKKTFLIFAMLCSTGTIFADSTQPVELKELSREEMVAKIMDLSGLDVQIPNIADTLNNQSSAMLAKLPDNIRTEMSNLIAVSFDGDTMLDIVKQEVSKSVSTDEAKEMLKWYGTDLGIEITKIEENDFDQEENKLIYEQKDELLSNHLRASLCEELDKAAHTTESALDLQISLMKAMLKMSGQDIQSSKSKKYIEDNKKAMEENIRKRTTLSSLYVYKDLDDEEIEKYIDFLNEGTTQGFIKAANKGISAAIMDGTSKFITGVQALKEKYKTKRVTKHKAKMPVESNTNSITKP